MAGTLVRNAFSSGMLESRWSFRSGAACASVPGSIAPRSRPARARLAASRSRTATDAAQPARTTAVKIASAAMPSMLLAEHLPVELVPGRLHAVREPRAYAARREAADDLPVAVEPV